MKKIYNTVLLALALSSGMAQTAFWTPTMHKGAFAPAPTPMWTDTWTEWDPQNKVYPSSNVTVNSNITTNTTWSTGQVVLLQGQIFVKNNAVLTIQPGVIVLGDKTVAGSGLFITKGAQLIANGTVSQPIVFTSDQPAGSRSAGDWGGIILMGKGDNNNPGGLNNVEGLAATADTEYGGGTSPDDNDNSGSLKYVRIEFPGYVYQPNKEINGLTFGAVGRGTTIDFIQVSFSNDDGYEWFGGAVNCKHLVSFRNLDDDFDTDNGFRGNVQYGLIVRDPAVADNPAVSTSEGFESDNDPSGSAATPQTAALFSNITAIGPYRGNSAQPIASGYRRGARVRRNSALKIMNSIFMDFKTSGIHIDGSASEANAAADLLKFKNNVVAQTAGVAQKAVEINSGSTFTIAAWFGASMSDSLGTTAGILVTPYNYTSPDYRPVSTNTLVTSGASFADPSFAAAGILGVNDLASFAKEVGLYPNPSNGNASLSINANAAMNINVSIFSVSGQLMANLYTNHPVNEGLNVLPINTNDLAAGIYFVKVSNGTSTETTKLVITK